MADIVYMINDPTRPDLVIPVDLPQKPGILDFKIDNFIGATDTLWTPEHEAACCHFTTVNAIKMLQKYCNKPFTKWANVSTLYIQPRAGRQLNAFYDRQAIRLFFGVDPKLKKTVYASNSTDVFAHELGHGIHDIIRPDLFHMIALEIPAWCEHFGDAHAVMHILQYDFTLDALLQETGGDLRKSNFLVNIGEELGTAIYNSTSGRMGHLPNTLRCLNNNYTYTEPEKLPMKGMDNQLTANPHSFSRVFSGAWWDIFVGMYETYKGGMSPKEALIKARDTLAVYTYGAMSIAPATIRFYDAMAKAMLVMDKCNNYEFNSMMNQKFIARNILRDPVRPMLSMDWEGFKAVSDPTTDEILDHENVATIRTKNALVLNLPEHMFNVEVPGDIYYEFNGTGECVDAISASNSELLDHAYFCVDFLKVNGMIRPDPHTPFEITKDGDLKRSHYACGCSGGGSEGGTSGTGGCCFDNGVNPNAPEYGKAYKIKNNRGCGCSQVNKGCNQSHSANALGINPHIRVVVGNLTR